MTIDNQNLVRRCNAFKFGICDLSFVILRSLEESEQNDLDLL
jgi:hypothetical protein